MLKVVSACRPNRYRWSFALLWAWLLISPGISDAQDPVKQVLVLQSLNRGNLPLDHFTADFRITLDERLGKPVNVIQVVVGPTGFVGATEKAVVDYIQASYAGHGPPDLIVTAGGPAATFAHRHRARLFPETPLLFASVDVRWMRGAPLGENEAAVPVINNWPQQIADMLQLVPKTRHVLMVIGSGALGQFWRRELETSVARFQDVTFLWSNDLGLPDILRRAATLPENSAIFYLAFGTDAQGGAYADEQVIADLHTHANAPLFGALTPLFGRGIVGGSMINISDLARNTADVASRILMGEPPEKFRLQPEIASQPMFDWRELQRWDIPESRLPPGSIVMHRRPSLWEEYRFAVLAALVVLVVQSLLITRLLYERRARRRAEIEARHNLSLIADANRRETMSALTTSIGHELAQPLSAILNNAQALQMMVTADGVRPDETGEILGDIKAEALLATQIIDRHRTMLRSRQLDLTLIDLHSVIHESLAIVAHDMQAREIEASVDLAPTPCVINGDAVLLEQAMLNLVRNAMDAMADTPPARRHIAIRTAVRSVDVQISVSDNGTGVPADIIGTLFTPFVTTKSNGLGIGLTVTQRIIDAHGGTIVAENTDSGAKFILTLPRSTDSIPLVTDLIAAHQG
jgi:signal transduction histidine kinase